MTKHTYSLGLLIALFAMLFLCDGDRELLSLIEKLLLDTQNRIASTEDVGISSEVKRADIRLAAKNINESGKLLINLMTARGPLAPNLGGVSPARSVCTQS